MMTQAKLLRSIAGEAKSEIIAKFRQLGGNIDRWSKRDIMNMAYSITVAEDKLELEGRWAAHVIEYRHQLRDIRRELENECT